MLERLKGFLSQYAKTEAVNRTEPSGSTEWDNYWMEQIDTARQEILPEHNLENMQIVTDRTCIGGGKQPVPHDVGMGYITSRIEAIVVECPNHNCFAEFVWTGERMVPFREAEQQIKEYK